MHVNGLLRCFANAPSTDQRVSTWHWCPVIDVCSPGSLSNPRAGWSGHSGWSDGQGWGGRDGQCRTPGYLPDSACRLIRCHDYHYVIIIGSFINGFESCWSKFAPMTSLSACYHNFFAQLSEVICFAFCSFCLFFTKFNETISVTHRLPLFLR